MKGFIDFMKRGNVVNLAVAVVIGAAFGAVVTALVKDILTPFIAAIVGKPNFSSLRFTINQSTFLYGDLINFVISFLAIATAVYFAVVLPLNRIAERREQRHSSSDGSSPSDDIVLLTEIRDLLAQQSRTTSADGQVVAADHGTTGLRQSSDA